MCNVSIATLEPHFNVARSFGDEARSDCVTACLIAIGVKSVVTIAPPAEVKEGWDAADALDEEWTTERAAELMALQDVALERKKATGIQVVVAQEFKEIAVPQIGPRLGVE